MEGNQIVILDSNSNAKYEEYKVHFRNYANTEHIFILNQTFRQSKVTCDTDLFINALDFYTGSGQQWTKKTIQGVFDNIYLSLVEDPIVFIETFNRWLNGNNETVKYLLVKSILKSKDRQSIFIKSQTQFYKDILCSTSINSKLYICKYLYYNSNSQFHLDCYQFLSILQSLPISQHLNLKRIKYYFLLIELLCIQWEYKIQDIQNIKEFLEILLNILGNLNLKSLQRFIYDRTTNSIPTSSKIPTLIKGSIKTIVKTIVGITSSIYDQSAIEPHIKKYQILVPFITTIVKSQKIFDTFQNRCASIEEEAYSLFTEYMADPECYIDALHILSSLPKDMVEGKFSVIYMQLKRVFKHIEDNLHLIRLMQTLNEFIESYIVEFVRIGNEEFTSFYKKLFTRVKFTKKLFNNLSTNHEMYNKFLGSCFTFTYLSLYLKKELNNYYLLDVFLRSCCDLFTDNRCFVAASEVITNEPGNLNSIYLLQSTYVSITRDQNKNYDLKMQIFKSVVSKIVVHGLRTSTLFYPIDELIIFLMEHHKVHSRLPAMAIAILNSCLTMDYNNIELIKLFACDSEIHQTTISATSTTFREAIDLYTQPSVTIGKGALKLEPKYNRFSNVFKLFSALYFFRDMHSHVIPVLRHTFYSLVYLCPKSKFTKLNSKYKTLTSYIHGVVTSHLFSPLGILETSLNQKTLFQNLPPSQILFLIEFIREIIINPSSSSKTTTPTTTPTLAPTNGTTTASTPTLATTNNLSDPLNVYLQRKDSENLNIFYQWILSKVVPNSKTMKQEFIQFLLFKSTPDTFKSFINFSGLQVEDFEILINNYQQILVDNQDFIECLKLKPSKFKTTLAQSLRQSQSLTFLELLNINETSTTNDSVQPSPPPSVHSMQIDIDIFDIPEELTPMSTSPIPNNHKSDNTTTTTTNNSNNEDVMEYRLYEKDNVMSMILQKLYEDEYVPILWLVKTLPLVSWRIFKLCVSVISIQSRSINLYASLNLSSKYSLIQSTLKNISYQDLVYFQGQDRYLVLQQLHGLHIKEQHFMKKINEPLKQLKYLSVHATECPAIDLPYVAQLLKHTGGLIEFRIHLTSISKEFLVTLLHVNKKLQSITLVFDDEVVSITPFVTIEMIVNTLSQEAPTVQLNLEGTIEACNDGSLYKLPQSQLAIVTYLTNMTKLTVDHSNWAYNYFDYFLRLNTIQFGTGKFKLVLSSDFKQLWNHFISRTNISLKKIVFYHLKVHKINKYLETIAKNQTVENITIYLKYSPTAQSIETLFKIIEENKSIHTLHLLTKSFVLKGNTQTQSFKTILSNPLYGEYIYYRKLNN
ncbi:hypothetical protein DLAC_08232 [Tieghemostelium lacteum]|uniref:Uncharacterized protein n=1 Tax=Tieghemostelium lacteum TaxID=361077 RepID=A0A151ZBG8_TIELA|nr:hypothetical protein DLAC_08232 [Tieghemostelium lacteum]|eukprot:KYQ91292.1 hypothetical protein DLAC_08232 [Tieghemostelium lacteum]